MGSIITPTGEKASSVPGVKGLKPFGSSILIEHLTPQEIMGTDLYVGDDAKTDTAPQGYIIALGPKVDSSIGLKVGDRVIVQGNFVPVPTLNGNKRVHGIIEVHNIKAILEEE